MSTRSASPGFAPLRVWLEPGYDGGRVGGWALDVPGAFAFARTPERALTATLSAAARVREWLGSHGEAPDLPWIRGIETVGAMAVVRETDGHDVNATFAPDLRRVDPVEVEAALRRLAWLREDLLALVAGLRSHEAAHGPLPIDAAAGERDADAVLRHLAGAEAWLLGRLDPAARYEGPLRDGPVEAALAGTRAWVVDQLRTRGAIDAGEVASDRHGETWTLAKVLRRLQSHAFDHLWELDRRLARVDGTVERVDVTLDRRPSGEEAAALLHAVGWDARAMGPELVGRAIAGSREVASAWDGEGLVGVARSMSDGALNALIATVLVHPRYQGLGVGERLMHALIDDRDEVRFALSAAPGVDDWYRKLGFLPDPHAMTRPRRHR
ncbi:MAG: GNAT family N-acetyltransferase [Candidatus Limnocylindrales bacterium]